ncbi:MAG: hypothetical protein P9M15_03200 [Candidatus Electryoneaceae bacterium]|nr:hypothetical protein [Candidatus Electryoneaceae bacterium]
MKLLTLSLAFLLCLPLLLLADILNVPDDHETIMGAIEAAEDNDTVLVEPGEYHEHINFQGKSIIVASLYLITDDDSYITETIIDGSNEARVVDMRNAEDEESVLCGFTIQNGAATYGGGIYCR